MQLPVVGLSDVATNLISPLDFFDEAEPVEAKETPEAVEGDK